MMRMTPVCLLGFRFSNQAFTSAVNYYPLEQFDLISFFSSFNNAVILLISFFCAVPLFFKFLQKFKISFYVLNFCVIFGPGFRFYILKVGSSDVGSSGGDTSKAPPSGPLPSGGGPDDKRKKLLNTIAEHLACKGFAEFLNSDELRKFLNSPSFKRLLSHKIFHKPACSLETFAKKPEGIEYLNFLKSKPDGFLKFMNSNEAKQFKSFASGETKYFRTFFKSPDAESLVTFLMSPEAKSFMTFWTSPESRGFKDFLGFQDVY